MPFVIDLHYSKPLTEIDKARDEHLRAGMPCSARHDRLLRSEGAADERDHRLRGGRTRRGRRGDRRRPVPSCRAGRVHGPDESFTLHSEIVAADGGTAVARAEVVYGDPPVRTYRNLWVITLLADGLCSAFEEWPFHPDQPLAAQ